MSLSLDLLDKQEILAALGPAYQNILDDLIILPVVDSTMNYLRDYISANQYLACFAEQQTAGRGQHGRKWVAPFGHNIYCSLLWHFNKKPAEILGLSLAIGVAVVRTLQEYGVHQQLNLKWPNDVLHQGKKLSGILIEIVRESAAQCSVIIGIGINTHLAPDLATAIEQPWTSLQLITHQPIKRNYLAGILLKHLFIALMQFTDQGLTSFLDEWQQFDQLLGKSVAVTTASQSFYGIMQGISAQGELILVDQHQKKYYFLSGEASLRPMSQLNNIVG